MFKSRMIPMAVSGLALTLMVLTGCESGGAKCPYSSPKADIVDTAVEAGSFNTLVTAVQKAGLVDALKGPGPFTVFAPTDEAFAQLPHGTLDSLLMPQNRSKLANVLQYHVVPGRVLAKDVTKLHSAATLTGQDLNIRSSGHGVMINDANVVKTDIMCKNGVIHVIDKVLIP